MKKAILRTIYGIAAIAFTGCAGASVGQELQSAPLASARPTQIVVYPFAVDPSEVTLNQGIVQRTYRSMSGADVPAQQLEIARQTAENVCAEVTAGLQQKGYSAVCQQRGIQPAGDNALIVDGEFTDISEGNRLRRMVIGFGAGASTLDTNV
jgi:hypothetical protein